MRTHKRQDYNYITVVVYIFAAGIASAEFGYIIYFLCTAHLLRHKGRYERLVFHTLLQYSFQDHRVMIGRYKAKILCDNRFYFKV